MRCVSAVFATVVVALFAGFDASGAAPTAQTDKPPLAEFLPPCLQNPAPDGITVCCYARSAEAVKVLWWEAGTSNRRETPAQVAAIPDTPWSVWKARLAGLRPGTRYEYQACYRCDGQSEKTTQVYRFTTFSNEGSIRFAMFNDLHSKLDTLDALMKHVSPEDYDFFVLNGDVWSDPGFSKTNDSVFRVLCGFIEKLRASEKPLVFVRGNHETRNNFSGRMSYLFDLPNLDATKPKTEQDWNFTLRAGPLWIVALDTGEDDDPETPETSYKNPNGWNASRQRQADWLKRVVERRDFGDAPWRVFVSHIPLYNNNCWYSIPSRQRWDETLRGADIDIELAGHDHGWKYLPKDTPYTFTVKNGAEKREVTDAPPWPVVIGGGPDKNDATVGLISADAKQLRARLLRAADGRAVVDVVFRCCRSKALLTGSENAPCPAVPVP